jgi:replication initiation and membrane attachment protein DnaB
MDEEYYNYRLLIKEEVPKWVSLEKKKKKEDLKNYGRG